jgi:Na+-translocating ferredoxin:NAD+ oxidoreductase RnfG subunit
MFNFLNKNLLKYSSIFLIILFVLFVFTKISNYYVGKEMKQTIQELQNKYLLENTKILEEIVKIKVKQNYLDEEFKKSKKQIEFIRNNQLSNLNEAISNEDTKKISAIYDNVINNYINSNK